MALLLPQFEQAKQNVEPSKEDKANAPKAHLEVRSVLEEDPYLSQLGVDTILIGSYARHVSIRRMRDVDVFSKLPNLPPDVSPRRLLKIFVDILTDVFGERRVEPQDRSIKVIFPDFDLHVDVVPGRPRDGHWEIPDRTERGGGWEETNPERLGELATEMNDTHKGEYIPTVKLIRQTRRANLGDQPGGLFFELLTYHAFASGSVKGANCAEYYCSALNGVVAQLLIAIDSGLADPTLPGRTITTRASKKEMNTAVQTFGSLAAMAEDALRDEDRCRAATKFRRIMGCSSEGDVVFPMPGDCKEDGTRQAAPAIVSGDRHVPGGDGRFA